MATWLKKSASTIVFCLTSAGCGNWLILWIGLRVSSFLFLNDSGYYFVYILYKYFFLHMKSDIFGIFDWFLDLNRGWFDWFRKCPCCILVIPEEFKLWTLYQRSIYFYDLHWKSVYGTAAFEVLRIHVWLDSWTCLWVWCVRHVNKSFGDTKKTTVKQSISMA